MKYIVLLLFVFAGTITWGQKITDPVELFEEGQYFFIRKDYKEALYFFNQLLKTDEANANFNFKVGECYLNIPGQEHLAVPYFEIAAIEPVPKKDYRSKDFNERKAPLHALFYLGNAYRAAGELENALRAYRTFIDSPYFYGNYNLGVVEAEMESCERAKIIQDSPIEMTKGIVKEPISTSFSESRPVLSKNGEKMAFLRGLKFYDGVFISEYDGEKWLEPVNISPEIGSDGDFYPTGMNSDGTVILLARNFDGNTDIYFSTFDGLNWSKAEKLPGKINSMADETYASFGEDDNIIYLVSERQGGRGGKDIWVSKKGKNNSWEKPKNLGKEINSELDEESPVICRQSGTLFFSSKGHYNMGGYDIFYSNKTEKGWTVPKNIGYPMNSTRDDYNYFVQSNCRSGYYSIIDPESGIADIYLIEINTLLAIPE